MSQYAFLEKSMELFDEAWREPHLEVMASYCKADELGNKCVMLSALLSCIEGANRPQEHLMTSGEARHLCDLALNWRARAVNVMLQVADLETEGFAVVQAEAIRSDLGRVQGWLESAKKLAASIDEINRGNFKTHEEVMNAIRS
jgi:predicted transcriptional regulator